MFAVINRIDLLTNRLIAYVLSVFANHFFFVAFVVVVVVVVVKTSTSSHGMMLLPSHMTNFVSFQAAFEAELKAFEEGVASEANTVINEAANVGVVFLRRHITDFF